MGSLPAYFTSEKGRDETHTQPAAFHATQRNQRPNLIQTVGKKEIQALTPVLPWKMRFSKAVSCPSLNSQSAFVRIRG